MKKILFILGFSLIIGVSLYSQEAVLAVGQSPAQFAAAGNAKWDAHSDSIKVNADNIEANRFLIAGKTVGLGISTAGAPQDGYAIVWDNDNSEYTLALITGGSGSSVLTDLTGTAWRVAYTDGSGDVTELALGADGTYLMSNGADVAPSFEAPAGGDHDAVTLAGTPNYITLAGQVITRSLINLASHVTGLLDSANINMAQLDAKYTIASDGQVVSYADGILATENITGDTVFITWDSTGIYDYVDGEIAGVEAGAGIVDDSLNLWFKDEIEPLFHFSAGNGNARDTAIFEVASKLGAAFNRSADTLVATSIVLSIRGDGGDTIQVQLAYNDTLANFSAEMVVMMEGSPMTVGTDENGLSPLTEYTTIINDTIPPDVWVWPHIAGVQEGEKPTLFAMTVSGYRVKGVFNDNLWAGDVTAPTLLSAELGTYNDTIILALFDENLHGGYTSISTAFELYGGTAEIGINAISVNYDSLFIALDSTLTVFNDSTLLLSYTPSLDPLQDSAGNEVAAWSDFEVTNNLDYGSGGGYTTEYQAVLDEMTIDPTGDTLTWQNDMFYSLDSAGLFDIFDILYITAQRNQQGASINIISPGNYSLTEVGAGSLTHTPYRGIDGDGTNYLTTGWNPATDAVNFSRNSMSIFVWITEDIEEDGFSLGVYDDVSTGHELYIVPHSTSDSYKLGLNTVVNPHGGLNTSDNFYVGVRTASDQVYGYLDGVQDAGGSNGSTTPYSADVYVLGCNTASAGEGQSTAEIAATGIGGAMTSTNVTDLNNILTRYFTRIGLI